MSVIARLERFIEALMSLATLLGFASTMYLLYIFISAPPVVSTGSSGVGVGGFDIWKTTTVTIQGIPFFWVFMSLISLSAGHTYRSAKHLVLHLAGKNPITVPHAGHFAAATAAASTASVSPGIPSTTPLVRQKQSPAQ
jgi:hypothetical protein